MKDLEGRPTRTRRADIADAFLRTKIGKLEKRLNHQRATGKTLDPDSILMAINDSVIVEMEIKLFKLKRAAGVHDPVPPSATKPSYHSA